MLEPRFDTELEVGLFHKDCKYPILYLAFAIADRPDLRHIANELLKTDSPPLILTRAVSTIPLPRHSFSLCFKHARRFAKEHNLPSAVLTAVNPFLGFTGASARSAGMQALAQRQVHYGYGTDGEYHSRRGGGRLNGIQKSTCLPNIIFGIPEQGWPTIPQISKVKCETLPDFRHDLSHALPDLCWDEVRFELKRYRRHLEQGWSNQTIHPDFKGVNKQIQSAGQCGVSSVWVAKKLRSKFNLSATYCYGDLSFDDASIEDVPDHCWLEVADSKTGSPYIIDVTVDQAAGYPHRILCEPKTSCASRGIHYNNHMSTPH